MNNPKLEAIISSLEGIITRRVEPSDPTAAAELRAHIAQLKALTKLPRPIGVVAGRPMR